MKKAEFAKVQKQISDQMNKYADKIIVGQYTGEKEPERKEGDFWKDRNGKQWTVKKGIKQSKSSSRRKNAVVVSCLWKDYD